MAKKSIFTETFSATEWVWRYCKIYSLADCQEKQLTPLLVLGSSAIVPEWGEFNRGGAGWFAKQKEIRIAAYQELLYKTTGHPPSQVGSTGSQAAGQDSCLFDTSEYKR